MKVGMKKPSIKKSISARPSKRRKRAVRKAIIPGYGKRGKKFCHRTTSGVRDYSYDSGYVTFLAIGMILLIMISIIL